MKVFDIIKIGSNLLKSKKIPSYILDSELLLSKTLDKSREEILTNLDQKVEEKKFFLFKQYLSRRSKHEPLAYILEEKEFWSKKFEVNNLNTKKHSTNVATINADNSTAFQSLNKKCAKKDTKTSQRNISNVDYKEKYYKTKMNYNKFSFTCFFLGVGFRLGLFNLSISPLSNSL